MLLGEVVHLGCHRLMCGDAGNPEHVATLMAGAKADLVFTSPPYLNQRSYGQPAACWDTLMQRVFGALPAHQRTQVLVNLGMVHRKGEWVSYWDGWIEWMRAQGWRRFGWYVWDKMHSPPGDWHGRLSPSFEFVFHFNRQTRAPNKNIPCKNPGYKYGGKRLLRGNGGVMERERRKPPTADFKIAQSVLRIHPEFINRSIGHPAVFPIALPVEISKAYTDPGEVLYEPFAGSGTSILAAEQESRVCYAMELNPSYCQIAIDRWERQKCLTPS